MLVSIIIPVWNGENYLEEAISTALSQTYPHKEVIVVNDGSTDKTGAILRRYQDRLTVITQENSGLGASRNAGVNAAQGELIAFLDHDDLWENTKIEQQVAAYLQTDNDPLIFTYGKQFICPTLSKEEHSRLRVNKTSVPGYLAGSLLLSLNRFQKIGPFTEKKSLGEFIDWYMRAKEQKTPELLLKNVLYYRRVHQTNMGREKIAYNQKDYLKVLKEGLIRKRAR